MDLRRPLDVITPTLDAEVLTVLVSRSDAQLTTGDVQRLIERRFGERRSFPGLRRTLERLAAQGIVEVGRAGRTGLYRLDHQHIAADLVVALARLRERLLHRIERRVSGWSTAPLYGALLDGPPGRGAATAEGAATVDRTALHLLLVAPELGGGDGLDGERWDVAVEGLVVDIRAWTGAEVVVHQLAAERLEDAEAQAMLAEAARGAELLIPGAADGASS